MSKNNTCTQLIRIYQLYKSPPIGDIEMKWCWFLGDKGKGGRGDSGEHHEYGGNLTGVLRIGEIEAFHSVAKMRKFSAEQIVC